MNFLLIVFEMDMNEVQTFMRICLSNLLIEKSHKIKSKIYR